jgi:hypothetical protein
MRIFFFFSFTFVFLFVFFYVCLSVLFSFLSWVEDELEKKSFGRKKRKKMIKTQARTVASTLSLNKIKTFIFNFFCFVLFCFVWAFVCRIEVFFCLCSNHDIYTDTRCRDCRNFFKIDFEAILLSSFISSFQ